MLLLLWRLMDVLLLLLVKKVVLVMMMVIMLMVIVVVLRPQHVERKLNEFYSVLRLTLGLSHRLFETHREVTEGWSVTSDTECLCPPSRLIGRCN